MVSGIQDLSVKDRELRKIVEDMNEGKFRIPEFQREFVWDTSDVVSLFDSIYQDYPIGTIFFWRVPESKWEFFRDLEGLDQPDLEEIRDSAFPEVNFVLDGQQRMTSIYLTTMGMTYQGTDYSKIVFDLEKEKFRVTDPDKDYLVSVSDIWSDTREIREKLDPELKDVYENCREKLRSYPTSTVIVQSDDTESVIDIFERINQEGTKLSRFDIVNANIWTDDFNLRRKIDEELMDKLEDKGFGKIDRGIVTQTLALVIEDTSTTTAQKNLEAENVAEEWEEVKQSILSSIDYLMNKNGVRRVEFLPYDGIIPVLAYYMYENGGEIDTDHQEVIDQWFWAASLSSRFSKSTQSTINRDKEKMDKLIEGKEIDVSFPVEITEEQLKKTNIKRSNSGLRNAFLCLLAKQNPKHFEDERNIDLTKRQFRNFRLNKHHIFPNSWLRNQGFSKETRKSIVDITFLPEDLNKKISDSTPKDYFSGLRGKENFEEIMESHMIPSDEDSAIWNNDFEEFMDQRAEIIYSKFMDLIGAEEVLLENTDEMTEFENKIRDYIYEKLFSENSEFWGDIPSDIDRKVEERIQDEKKNNPEIEISSDRDKLDYCDIMDYSKIIHTRWDKFEEDFPSKEEVEKRFDKLNKYRRAIAHGRDQDKFTEMDGKVSIQWIESCINSS